MRLKYHGDHCNRPVKDLDFIEPELEHSVRVVLQCVPHVPENISHYLSQLTSHYPKYLLLWSAIMNQGPSSIFQYFVFEALLSAHPLSSVKIGEICSGQMVIVSACVPRSLTQLSPPQKLRIAREGPCCQCQADSMLPSAVKCSQS